MNKKCDKYEGYFTFSNEADFEAHLAECEDCQKEHQIQNKVSALLKEAAPKYRKKEKTKFIRKMAACFVVFMLTVGSIVPVSIETYQISQMSDIYDEYMTEGGFLYDEYGLVQI